MDEYDVNLRGYEDGEDGYDDADMNNQDKELIYNEDSGFANADKLFNEEVHEAAVYEIEFKIFDKINKNVFKLNNS